MVAPEEKQPNTIMLKGQGGYYISINNHEVQAVSDIAKCHCLIVLYLCLLYNFTGKYVSITQDDNKLAGGEVVYSLL